MIFNYFKKVKDRIDEYRHIISANSITEKNYSEKRGYIGGKINFMDNSQLDFAEVKDIEIESKIKFRYHYMDEENEMLFRYDNSRHYPEISTFPNHKHTAKGIIPCNEPEIDDILSEIEKQVVKKG